jgi:flagellin-like protein
MKQNERAVSPVIGVMLMIVVTIIIAAVVSAFAANTDMARQTGPSATLESKILFSPVPQTFYSYGEPVTVYFPKIDCNKYSSTTCMSLDDYPELFGTTCTADSCIFPAGDVDLDSWNDPNEDFGSYGRASSLHANLNGFLFTHNGGDPIDLDNLVLTMRYYDLASTVYASDVKKYVQFLPRDFFSPDVKSRSTAAYFGTLKYFFKVNATSEDDTIVRPGDQFVFLVDDGYQPPDRWALSSYRSTGNKGASVGIDPYSGETEWWLKDGPSGNTLAHGNLEIPLT